MAGLNFVGNAAYNEPDLRGLNGESNIENVAVFEFIPWILSQCATIDEAKERLKFINLTNTQFNEMFPCANLHWIIADKENCVTVESMSDGLHIYDNPVGCLLIIRHLTYRCLILTITWVCLQNSLRAISQTDLNSTDTAVVWVHSDFLGICHLSQDS